MLLPRSNPYVSGEISVFDALVREGERRSFITLPFQLHSFLVGCLVEYLQDQEIVHHVLALGLLQSSTKLGEQGNVLLKRTGGAALILAGFYPERARRLRVSSVYFRFMGQAAYASLAAKLEATGKPERGRLYDRVSRDFHALERVLSSARAQSQFGADWESFQWFLNRIQ